jgi:hypothetical protein
VLVTATCDKTIGEAASDENPGALVKNIMQEIVLIARTLKIELLPEFHPAIKFLN